MVNGIEPYRVHFHWRHIMSTRQIGLLLLALISFGCICGCISIRGIALDNLTTEGGPVITSHAEGIGIVHVVVPKAAEMEDMVLADLRAQGATKNVRLRLQVRDFLLAVQLYEVIGQGEK